MILLIPLSFPIAYGRHVADRRQGRLLLGVITAILLTATGVAALAESSGNPALTEVGVDQSSSASQSGGNLEGKEVRFGSAASGFWAAATTNMSNGSVNSTHDSFTPLLAESAQTAIVAARVRRRELAAMTNFLEHIGTPISAEELGEHASASILGLLDARECVWRPDYMGTASPVLKPDGTLTSMRAGDWDQGGGVLPSTIEIPVGCPPAEYGRFIVQTNHRASVSLEERRAAANVATTLSRCIRP